MSQFMKALALLLNDRQEFRLNAVKIKDDLVLTIVPDFKGKGNVTNLTIPAADLEELNIDATIIGKLSAPVDSPAATFQSSTTDDGDDEKENIPAGSEKGRALAKEKLAAARKEAAKKAPAKKVAPAKTGKTSAPVKATQSKATVAKPERDEDLQKIVAAANEVELDERKTDQQSSTGTEEKEITEEPEKDIGLEGNPDAQSGPTFDEDEAPAGISNTETTSSDQVNDTPADQEKANEKKEDAAGPSNKELFDHFMEEGKRFFDERKYEDAQQSYTLAKDLFPDNKKAIEAHAQASKWVKAIADLNKNKKQ